MSHSPSFGTPDSHTKLVPTSLESNYQSIPNSHTPSVDFKLSESETKLDALESEQTAGSLELDQETKVSESEHTPQRTESRQEADVVETVQETEQDPSQQVERTSEEHESEISSLSSPQLVSDQTSQANSVVSPDKSIHRECGESHENLHGTHLEAMKNESNNLVTHMTTESMAIGNGHIALKNEEYHHLAQIDETDQSNREQHATTRTHFKIQLKREDGSSSSLRPVLGNGLSPLTSPNKPCNGGLLREAMNDVSPHMALRQDPPVRAGVSGRLGVDGLPVVISEAQGRVRELVAEPWREIQRLRGQLREIQLSIHKAGVGSGGVRGGGVGLVEGEGVDVASIEDQILSALDDQVCQCDAMLMFMVYLYAVEWEISM